MGRQSNQSADQLAAFSDAFEFLTSSEDSNDSSALVSDSNQSSSNHDMEYYDYVDVATISQDRMWNSVASERNTNIGISSALQGNMTTASPSHTSFSTNPSLCDQMDFNRCFNDTEINNNYQSDLALCSLDHPNEFTARASDYLYSLSENEGIVDLFDCNDIVGSL